MITPEDLQILKSFDPQENGYVLSIYLNTDQAKATNLNRGYERMLSNLFRSLEQGVNGSQVRQLFEANCQKVWKFINGYTPGRKSLLIFSDAAQNFWWDEELSIDLPNLARFSHSLFLRPLLTVLDEYKRYGVVLIDQGRARFFTHSLGEIEEHEGVFEDVPPVTQTAGRDRIVAQKRLQRHHDEHLHWHTKNVVERLKELTDRSQFDHLALGGSTQAISELQQALPKSLQRLVRGTLSLPIQATPHDVLSETRKLETAFQREQEERLVETLITAAHKGNKATLGLADTIQATNEGRIWKLIYVKDFFASGYICSQCRMLYLENRPDRCLYCGGALSPTPSLVSQAIERVIGSEGQIEEVRHKAGEKLARKGHIGALLRY